VASDLSQLGFLLFVSALVAMLMRRLRLPYTVGLVLAGMGLYFLRIYVKWHLSTIQWETNPHKIHVVQDHPPMSLGAGVLARWW